MRRIRESQISLTCNFCIVIEEKLMLYRQLLVFRVVCNPYLSNTRACSFYILQLINVYVLVCHRDKTLVITLI